MSNEHSHYHEEVTAKKASRLNYILGSAQGLAALVLGNFGFVPDFIHNIADGRSFADKAKATDTDSQSPEEIDKLRIRAAQILGATGIFGFVGALVSLKTGHKESTEDIALGAAFASAAVNTVVAKLTHNHSEDSNKSEAFKDATLHAFTDFGTSWVYAASLVAERFLKVPDITNVANIAIAFNGLATTTIAGYTLKKIGEDSHVYKDID